MKNVGRDPKTGLSIPHRRDEMTAYVVAQYSANGADENTIACLLNIRPGLLRMHYGRELRDGLAAGNMAVISNVHRHASMTDNTRAMELWLRNRAGWDRDKKQVQDVPTLSIFIHG